MQAYIKAMPGWKRDVGKRLDALIERTVPDVRKAVRWNSPIYGIEGQGCFASFHVLTKYVKVTFFNAYVGWRCLRSSCTTSSRTSLPVGSSASTSSSC